MGTYLNPKSRQALAILCRSILRVCKVRAGRGASRMRPLSWSVLNIRMLSRCVSPAKALSSKVVGGPIRRMRTRGSHSPFWHGSFAEAGCCEDQTMDGFGNQARSACLHQADQADQSLVRIVLPCGFLQLLLICFFDVSLVLLIDPVAFARQGSGRRRLLRSISKL